MIDNNNPILQLGGEVEGEARARQARPRWWDLVQHVAHDVVAVWTFIMSKAVHYKHND